jgi:hypothetical protein
MISRDDMTEKIDVLAVKIMIDLAERLGIDVEEVEPETLAFFETSISAAIHACSIEIEEEKRGLAEKLAEIEDRELKTAEYEPLARDISYRLGYNDGIQTARDLVTEQFKSDKKVREKIEKTIPKENKSRIHPEPDVSHDNDAQTGTAE